MRTLKFIVNDQKLTPDPKCDFEDLVPGTEGYLQAEFIFSKEWDGCAKVAGFYNTTSGKEYPPQPLTAENTCMIPAEATAKRTFAIQLLGVRKDFKITTNKTYVCQTGGV